MDSTQQSHVNKIAVFYGHVASNLGDLAINVGELIALKRAYPGAEVKFVALHVSEGPTYDNALAETACAGESTWSIYRTSFRHVLTYLSNPGQVLLDCGMDDVDLIVLASGEHLFAYADNPNTRALYWRTLPALAAKAAGKRCVLFPSTFGPYETEQSRRWMQALFTIVDGYAVRESSSGHLLSEVFGLQAQHFPDPAFFIEPARRRDLGKTEFSVLGLAMRAEDWGIRLSKERRADSLDSTQATDDSAQALEFAVAAVSTFLAQKPDGQVRVFVQTTADQQLADRLYEQIHEQGLEAQVKVIKPETIADYLEELANVDGLIASRFHALIMGLITHVPVYGVYFSVHGHKIPGLFSWLGLTSSYRLIEANSTDVAMAAVEGLLAGTFNWGEVDSVLHQGRQEFCEWLGRLPAKNSNEGMLEAALAINELAKQLIADGYEQQGKTQKEKLLATHENEFELKVKALRREFDVEQVAERSGFVERYEKKLVEELAVQREQLESERDFLLDELKAKSDAHLEAVKQEQSLSIERMKRQHEVLKKSTTARLKKQQDNLEQLSKLNVQLQYEAAQLRGQLGVIRGSTSYQMAAEAARALRSRRKLFSLPARLYAIYSETRSNRREASLLLNSLDRGDTLAHGMAAIEERNSSPSDIAVELIRECKALSDQGHFEQACDVASRALELHRSEATLRALFWAQQGAGCVEDAFQTVQALQQYLGNKPSLMQKDRLDLIRSQPAFQLNLQRMLPARAANAAFTPIVGRLAYVLHNSLPFSSGGYATRAQGLAKGLVAQGHEVIAFTRPGYPRDINKSLDAGSVPDVQEVDGITYVRTFEPSRKKLRMQEFMPIATDVMAAHFRHYKPEVVVAASNYICALPALFAARRLGLPFIYEVRGFWEITRLSREPGFINHASYKIQELMEAFVCKEADKVLTLTEAMKVELIRRGVDGNKIDIIPNACQPELFEPCPRDGDLAADLGIPANVPVIGYVGTFVDYEGLDDLARACGILKSRGLEFRLLMVGNENVSGTERGPIAQAVIAAAEEFGFLDWLIMPGRVPHEKVASYYSLIDIAPFPRKPWPVCEMVSPMKPLEAMAMEKAVVVSSVSALAEMAGYGDYGVIFDKGSENALADALTDMLADPALRKSLGQAGRQHVLAERTWMRSAQRFADALPKIAVSVNEATES